jgi:hypothetical protein
VKLVAILWLLSSTLAAADSYDHAVSVQLATLDKRSGTLQYERDLGTRKLSLAGAVGVRTSALGDYRSLATGVGVELRRWIRRPTTMTGWYTAVRTDLARTTVEDVAMDRDVGALVTWSAGIGIGRRWVVFDALELTPSLGLAVVVEGGMDGRSPTTARGALSFGFTAGYIF